MPSPGKSLSSFLSKPSRSIELSTFKRLVSSFSVCGACVVSSCINAKASCIDAKDSSESLFVDFEEFSFPSVFFSSFESRSFFGEVISSTRSDSAIGSFSFDIFDFLAACFCEEPSSEIVLAGSLNFSGTGVSLDTKTKLLAASDEVSPLVSMVSALGSLDSLEIDESVEAIIESFVASFGGIVTFSSVISLDSASNSSEEIGASIDFIKKPIFDGIVVFSVESLVVSAESSGPFDSFETITKSLTALFERVSSTSTGTVTLDRSLGFTRKAGASLETITNSFEAASSE
mmetsp:Transcript_28311/g.43382  ORF Transcript_28311/g.43382 Transcript_28311/m.43382 type:complete len:289 (+) Transcript_28311:279-1145(+)